MGDAARFCDQCGTSVASATGTDESPTRKVVTVLFADLVGSTAFGERVDAESAREAMAEFHEMAQSTIDAESGTVAKFIGDGVMALFGVPETAEDDADRAVAAALVLQRAFGPFREGIAHRHGVELGLRVGINTGEIVLADGDADLVGDAINTAARLEAACAPGEVLVGEDTWRLTRAHVHYEVLGEVDVRGKSEPVATFRVADDAVHDDDQVTPFVGRVEELARLRATLDEAIDIRAARLATVVGSPGVGKTRVAREFAESLGDAAVVADLRCERSGTATFAPIASLLRTVTSIEDESDPDHVRSVLHELVAGLDDADRVVELLASFVGAAPVRSTEEAFLAVRRLVEAVGRVRPLVVIVDDIQWAESLFLDLLEHLAEWVADAPALLIGLARPELRELRPTLTEENNTVTAMLALEGLDAVATAELAARLVGADSLPRDLIERLPESTEGNPLFVRELMRMLVDDGVIEKTGNGWQLTIDAEAVEVPPTIQSLLAARLDRMPGDERRLVELASVVGPEFPLGAVGAISESGVTDLRMTLERLRRRELVESTGMYWGDEAIYRFHHVLIRDAAYRRLLKRTRAELHHRVGEWTERTATGLPGEHEVAIAHHYEHAHEYRRQLDDVDEATAVIGRRAAELLGAAAERSLKRDDMPAASTLAERALTRLDQGDPMIPSMLVVAAEALLDLGDVTRGRPVVGRLSDLVGTDERLGPWAESFVAQLTMLTEPDRLHEAEAHADLAATRLTELGDEAGVAKARLVRAGALARLGQVGRCEAELDEALTAARSAGDRRRVAAVLGAAPLAALWGPSPIPRAGGRCLDVIRLLRITTGSPAVEATSVRCQAVLEALRGRFDTARTMLTDARATVEELGLRHALNETDLYTGIVELLAGDAEAAEGPLRAAHQGLGRLGIGADAGQAAAYLARAVLQLDRVDEAEQLAAESSELAGENRQTAIAARTAQAEILAVQGRYDEAVDAASDAVARAQGTDIIVDHAAASAVLARVAGLAGDAETAEQAARVAADLYQQKAATVATPIHSETTPPVPKMAFEGSGSEIDQLHTEARVEEPELRNAADRLARRFVAAFTAGARDEWLKMLSPDQETIDRRPLGFDTTGADEVAAAYPRDRQTRAMESAVETIAVRGDSFALLRWKAASAHGREWDDLHLTRWTTEGLNDLNVIFPSDQLDEALAELDRLYIAEDRGPTAVEPRHERPGNTQPIDHEPWNEADRLARRLIELFFDMSSEAWSEMLDPGHVSIDRQPIVAHRLEGRDATVAIWTRENMDDDATSVAETIATRGEHLALHRWAVAMGSGRWASDVLNVTRWNERGLVDLNIRFEPDQLREAVEELERLYQDELGDSTEALQVRELGRGMRLLSDGHVDPFIDLHDPSFVMRDHRQLGWGNPTLEDYRARMASIADVAGHALVFQERMLRLDDTTSLCAAQRLVLTTSEGSQQVSRSVMTMITDPQTGLITLMEQFEEDQVDRAVERFDELMVERGPVLHNEASRRVAFINGWLRRGDDELAAGAIADDAIFVDEQGDSFGLSVVDRREVIAVRGDRLALVQLSGPSHAFAVEEIDEAGKLASVRRFGSDQLVDAVTHLEQVWLEIEGAELPAAARIVARYRITQNEHHPERLAALLADHHALIDHRPFGWPDLDRAGVLEAAAPLDDMMRHALVVSEILAASPSATLGRHAFWSVHEDGTATQGLIGLAVAEVCDERVGVIELFTEDDLEAATARFEALGGSLRSDVAVLGDTHRLERVEGGDFELTVVDDAGNVIETVRYPAEEESAARHDLTARWFGGLNEARRRVGQLAVALGEAWVAPTTHTFDDLITADFQLVDARTLGMGSSDRAGFEEALRGREADGTTGPPVPTRVELLSDDVMVFRAHNVGQAPDSGIDWEEIACNVLVVEGDRIARLEMFDEDHWDDAVARAAELVSEMGVSATLENAATRLRDRFTESGGAVEPGAYAPGFTREDRRATVSDETAGRDDYLDSISTYEDMGAKFTMGQALAIRGERFALFPASVEFDGSVIDSLVVSEVGEDGGARRSVQFDRDDLASAQDELDQMFATNLPPDDAHTLRTAMAFRDAYAALDMERVFSLLGADFQTVDHRPVSWPSMDRERFATANDGRKAVMGEGHILTTNIQLIRNGVILASNELTGRATDTGTEWSEQFVNVFVVTDGSMSRIESFLPGGIEEANARAEELIAERDVGIRRTLIEGGRITAEPDDFSPDFVPHVQRLGQRVVDATAARDFDTVLECLDEDFVRFDRRRVIGLPDMTRDEYVADLQRQWELGWRDYRTVAVESIRSNGFVALLTTDFEGGSESPFRVLLVEGSTGRIGRLAMYDEDDVQSADDDLDEAWLATLDPADAETYRVATEQYRAYVGLDGSRVEELTADRMVFADHRRLGNFGQLDRSGFLELFEARRDTLGPGEGRVTAVHLIDHGVIVWSKEERTHSENYGADTTSAGIHVVRVVKGEVDLGEIYDDADLTVALSRAEVLVDPSPHAGGHLLENGATRWVERVVARDGPAHVEAFAEDFVRDDRRSTMAAEPADRDQFVEGLRVQRELGAVWSSQVVAIRGDRFGLCRLTSRSGSRVQFLATIEVDDAGRAVRAAYFDGNDPSAATGAMSRSWAATLPRELLGPLRLAAEYERVAYTAGLEGGSFFADDAVVVDHRSVGLGESDLSGYLRLHGRRADDGPVTGFAPEVIPVSPHVLLFSNVNTIETGDGASWEEFYFQVFVAPDGKITRLELFAEDQRDAALRRAQELASSRSLDAT